MGINQHEIPILEFDDHPRSVIMPDHEQFALQLPKKAVFAFLGDVIEAYAAQARCEQIATFQSITKAYPIYQTTVAGEAICFCQAPVGAAAATQICDWLLAYGVEVIIATGSCGVLVDMPENTFLIPTKALRAEGTSYHYLPPSRYVHVHPQALLAIEQTLNEHGIAYREVVTWTTDGFFRETPAMVAYRQAEGCEVVEMECAALAACAHMRGAIFGQILFTADSLADLNDYDRRGFGSDAHHAALTLSFASVAKLSRVD